MTADRWPALMDKGTAARYLSVSVSTLGRIVADGDLPTIKVRAITRYTRDDLDAYIARARATA